MSAHVVVGVAGGIAAYKSCTLVRLLTEGGLTVTVVPTAAALRFVGAPTWEALSGRPVRADMWESVSDVPHVRIGRSADLVVVAPATADLIARAAHGLADDMLTNVLLTATCPVLMAPAMHTEMWLHPATRANVDTLQSRGVRMVGPVEGRLTGADSGPGRLAEPDQIAEAVRAELARPGQRDLVGRHVVVTAGGTREAVDPVRYLGNRSTGKQGAALAAAAVARGARVTFIHAAVDIAVPVGVEAHSCPTAESMHRAVLDHAGDADVLVMAAAVADFSPVAADSKIKKTGASLTITAEPTVDILRDAVARRGGSRRPVIVGFAAETGDGAGGVLLHAERKLHDKGCDLLVVNDVRGDRAFGSDDNEVMLMTGSDRIDVPRSDKMRVSHAVWDRVGELLADNG